MKKFLKQLAGFLCLALGAYGLLVGAYLYMFDREVEKSHQLRPEAQILVLGDSHPECAVNDLEYSIFENRARSSEIYYLSYLKLKYILEHGENAKNLKAICLVYNFFSLGQSRQNRFAENTSLANSFLLKYAPLWQSLENYPRRYGYPCYRSDLSIYLSSHLPKIEDVKDLLLYITVSYSKFQEYRGSFLSEHKAHLDEEKIKLEIENLQTKYKYPDGEEYQGSELEEKMLRMILDLAKQHNIPVALINTPEHPILVENTPQSAKDYHFKVFEDLQRDYDVYYLNYHEMELEDRYFYDFGHLNVDGANVFTPILLKDLRKLNLIP